MEFDYFKGPKTEMAHILEGMYTCSFCEDVHPMCFRVDYAITDKFLANEREGKVGCVNCLKEGKFEFWHDTEFGMLDENGLSKIYTHNMDTPPPISPTKLSILRRTPQIITWQQELWLTHCDDFMVYKGTWNPKDFIKNSPNGDGRALFMHMTSAERSHLWDDNMEEGKTVPEKWYATYYVFECAHCGTLRGNWDSP